MKTNKIPSNIADDVIVSLDYTLTVDGELIDASNENEPIEFLQGHQNIIHGLEKELYGLAVGDSREIIVAPRDGYGELDPQAIMEIPRKEFPQDIDLQIGTELALQQPDGHEMHAVIAGINSDSVKLDFNHPLAGKELTFRVTVAGLRTASDEEIAHGHVHGQHVHDDGEGNEEAAPED